MGSLSSALGPWSLMKDLVDKLLVVLKAAVARMLHRGSVSRREIRSKAISFSKLGQIYLTIR
jgi:hypothetical protein